MTPLAFTPRILAVALAAALAAPGQADVMHVADSGVGQVLIYPYYTARNGTVSLLSVVNTADQAKAVRVRMRESVAGRMVAEFNLFLSAYDVWTGAIVPSGEGATIVTNDRSCTSPKLGADSPPLQFSPLGYSREAPVFGTPPGFVPLGRTREGYVELIEMASIGNNSALGTDVTHVAGVPPCKLNVTMADPTIASSLQAPSGGLMGSMSFINLTDGLGVSYNATAIERFWSTAPGKPATSITTAQTPDAGNTRSEPDLASGGNGTMSLLDRGLTYVGTFTRSIDAVSALFTGASFFAEYGYTRDGTFDNTFVYAMPTKPYYIHESVPDPFDTVYSTLDGKACVGVNHFSTDREEFVGVTNDDFATRPPAPPGWSPCDVINSVSPSGAVAATALTGARTYYMPLNQNAGVPVVTPGKEGGHVVVAPTNPNARLIASKAVVLKRSASTGEIETTNGKLTLFGLPIIGFTLSAAKYNTGTPQQNFGNLTPMGFVRSLTVNPN